MQIRSLFETRLNTWKAAGYLAVAYNLLLEGVGLATLAFLGLFTLETFLPGLISGHLSLTIIFFFILTGTFFLSLIGKFLSVSLEETSTWTRPIIIFLGVWGILLVLLSLYKFPWWGVLTILALLAVTAWVSFRATASTEGD